MPNRILRDGILQSVQVNSLSAESELFYRRLMSVVDDYGRYSAHPALLRAALYPLQLKKVRETNIVKWRAECVAAGLVRLYTHSGSNGVRSGHQAGPSAVRPGGELDEYLEVLKFRQQVRTKSKFPDPPDKQMTLPCMTDAHQFASSVISDRYHAAHLGGDGGGDVKPPLAPPSQGGRDQADRRKRRSACPETIQLTEAMFVWAKSIGLDHGSVERETSKFLDHHTGKGSIMADWDAAWRSWMRKAVEFGARR